MIAPGVRLPGGLGADTKQARAQALLAQLDRAEALSSAADRALVGAVTAAYSAAIADRTATPAQLREFDRAAAALIARARTLGDEFAVRLVERALKALSLQVREQALIPGAAGARGAPASFLAAGGFLPPSPATPSPLSVGPAGRPGRIPRRPRRPREPRDPRAARAARARRAPRRPRRAREARPARRPRAPRRFPPIPPPDDGWANYCAIPDPVRWRGLPATCHRLHISQVNAVRAGGGELVLTHNCAGCQGKGCSGPFADILRVVMQPFVSESARPELVREAAAAALERRAQRRRGAVRGQLDAAARRAGPLPDPLAPPPPGWGWYRCTTPTGPLSGLAPRCVWLHQTQAAAVNRAGGRCEGPLGHNQAERPC